MAKIPPINLSSAISSYRVNFNRLLDSIGDLALLNTDSTATIVGAINSIDSNQGTRLSLTTSDKTDLVSAINELDGELGTITTGAMGTTASTVSGAIAELDARLDSINNTKLNTPAVYASSGGVYSVGAFSTDNDLIVRRNSFIGNDNPLIPTSIYMYSSFARALLPVNDASPGKNLGDSNRRWKHVFTENIVADSGTIFGDLNVIGNLTASTQVIADSAVVQGIIDSNLGDSNAISSKISNRSIGNNKLTNNNITINGVTFALGESKVIDTTDSGVQIALIKKVMRADSDTGIHYDSAGLEFSLGNIPNTSLSNSSFTINGTTFNLGDDSSIVVTNAQLENSTFSVNGVSGSLGSNITVDVTDSAAIQNMLDSSLGDLNVNVINKGPAGSNTANNLAIKAGGILNLHSSYGITGGTINMFHQYNYADSQMFSFYGTGGTSTMLSAFAPMKLQTFAAFDAIELDATGNIYLDADADVFVRKGGTNIVHFDTITTGTNQMKFLNTGGTDISVPNGEDLKLLCKDFNIDLDGADDAINFMIGGTTQAQIIPQTAAGKTAFNAGTLALNATAGLELATTGAYDIDITSSGGDINLLAAGGTDDINIEATQNVILKHGASVAEYVQFGNAANTVAVRIGTNFANSTYISSVNATNSQTGLQLISDKNALKLAAENSQVIFQSVGSVNPTAYFEWDSTGAATDRDFKLYTGYPGTATLNSTWTGDDFTVQGDITSISDERTKENIETIPNGLEMVDALRGVYYNKIGETERKVGVIAQEVETILPEVVKTNNEGMKSVDYGKMIGVLIEAIKDLKHEIDDLKRGL